MTTATVPLSDTMAAARRDSAEFPVLLANHAPMILVAMRRLGAPDARIAAWFAQYRQAKKLYPMPAPVAPITGADWLDHLGDRSREADYRAFMRAEIHRLGRAATLRRYLPALLPGIGASATHPLMRIAYALLADDDDEIGAALGYWAACFLPLPVCTGQRPDTDDPLAVLAGVGAIPGARDYDPGSHLLWHHIRTVAALPEFAPVGGRLEIGQGTLAQMAAVGLNLYAATLDFAALHVVTGLHWCRLLLPWLDGPEPLLRPYWQVVAALVPYIGFPDPLTPAELDEMRRLPAPPWEEIARKAIASEDEHDISLTFSAREEEKIYGDPLYRVVAARRLGLLS
ncbi:questin oxidase family protein [Salipiger sp. P9]|uniref:questin oxidase family protein n=1 Tax=Salipiger pentaromativorans TaxID=2943193 RepID=UPI002158793C|nr:questin oxidase family protein [Salipiger pentaromativorans]MCR8546892.1 questin oxidase family protein [Salipiger pentaromativorans]